MSDHQKILNLKVENFKRIQLFEHYPDPNTNIISGKNGSGKSSVLDAISWAIGGKKNVDDTPQPIRNGEKKAEINIELNDLIIRRSITPSGDRIEVLRRDGTPVNTPQKVLDSLYGAISFDPLKFKDMSSKDQLKLLFNAISSEVSYDDLENEKKQYLEERKELNREVKKLQMYIENFPPYTDEELNLTAVSGSEILTEIDRVNDLIDKKNKLSNTLENLRAEAIANKEKIENLYLQIKQLEERNDEIIGQGKMYAEHYEQIVIDKDINELKENLKNIEQYQKKYNKIQDYKKTHAELTEITNKAVEADTKIKQVEAKKMEIFQNAQLPIGDLSFNDDTLIYKDIPFSQLSTSEKLRLSFLISCVVNPKLKVMLIRDGSLLDKENMELLKKIAEYFNVQIWVEVVDDNEQVGIILEDGKIKDVKGV